MQGGQRAENIYSTGKAAAAVLDLLQSYNRLHNIMVMMPQRIQPALLLSKLAVNAALTSTSPILAVPSQAWASLNASVALGRRHYLQSPCQGLSLEQYGIFRTHASRQVEGKEEGQERSG
jgi:hypothetical protein